MTTTLSFTVVVTSCGNCPKRIAMHCMHEKYACQSTVLQNEVWLQNKDQLTNSCPMIKEGEKK